MLNMTSIDLYIILICLIFYHVEYACVLFRFCFHFSVVSSLQVSRKNSQLNAIQQNITYHTIYLTQKHSIWSFLRPINTRAKNAFDILFYLIFFFFSAYTCSISYVVILCIIWHLSTVILQTSLKVSKFKGNFDVTLSTCFFFPFLKQYTKSLNTIMNIYVVQFGWPNTIYILH